MIHSEFKYLGTTKLRKREIGSRKVTKETYINHLLSVKLVNKYTLICVNELELMEYSRRGSEFDSIADKLRNWYESDYEINISDYDFTFPILNELAYMGEQEALQTYNKLISNRAIIEKLIDIDFNNFFKDIYDIYLEQLEKGEVNMDLAKRIKLEDLCSFYYYQYKADILENDFYLHIWDKIKFNLKIPISLIDEDIIKELFKAFEVKLWTDDPDLNYEAYSSEYNSKYNRTFFKEIIDPILMEILTTRPKLKTQFILEFNNKINSLNKLNSPEIILIDVVLKCSDLTEDLFEYNSCVSKVYSSISYLSQIKLNVG